MKSVGEPYAPPPPLSSVIWTFSKGFVVNWTLPLPDESRTLNAARLSFMRGCSWSRNVMCLRDKASKGEYSCLCLRTHSQWLVREIFLVNHTPLNTPMMCRARTPRDMRIVLQGLIDYQWFCLCRNATCRVEARKCHTTNQPYGSVIGYWSGSLVISIVSDQNQRPASHITIIGVFLSSRIGRPEISSKPFKIYWAPSSGRIKVTSWSKAIRLFSTHGSVAIAVMSFGPWSHPYRSVKVHQFRRTLQGAGAKGVCIFQPTYILDSAP